MRRHEKNKTRTIAFLRRAREQREGTGMSVNVIKEQSYEYGKQKKIEARYVIG